MSSRLFVGNLPFHATEELIQKAFAASGDVKSVNLMLDRVSGQSRGFGFVDMATPEAAQKAIRELDGSQFEGRTLRVDIAQERGAGGGGGRSGGRR